MDARTAIQWTIDNRARIISELVKLFWLAYAVVLPKLFETGIPQPYDKVCLTVATVLTFYGLGNPIANAVKRMRSAR